MLLHVVCCAGSAGMWLVVVVGRCVVGCEHCEGYCSTCILLVYSFTSQFAHDARSQKPKTHMCYSLFPCWAGMIFI